MIEKKMEIIAGKCPIEAGGNCPLRPQGEWITFDELRGWLTAQGFSSGTVEDKVKEFKRYIERSREDE